MSNVRVNPGHPTLKGGPPIKSAAKPPKLPKPSKDK